MPSKKEIAAGVVGVSVLAKSPAARRALVGVLRQGGRTLGPWGLAAWLAYEGYVRRDEIRSVANEIAERLPPAVSGQGGDPTFGALRMHEGIPHVDIGSFFEPFREQRTDMPGFPLSPVGSKAFRRKARKKAKSKFNKAVSAAMKELKKKKGKILKGTTVFSKATKIASKANPATKSKIGKGKSFAQRTARKIRKSIWGTLRRK